jgi:FAD/FMN-containing dehydrogenase
MTIKVAARDGGTTTLDDPTLAEFAMSFHGDVLTPDDVGYDDARVTYNAMIDRRPAIILRCSGTADVVDAVNLVRDHGLLASVRGGGHSVAGLSVHDDAVMIDLSRMRGVHVDPKRQRARVQGGAELGDLDRETQLYGLATPAGVISTTGVAGLTLGGGFGWLRRKYGLTCDNLVSAEIVTADGQVVLADENQHPDLFWALRGGGGNFGIVTSFEFRVHPVGPLVYAAIPMYAAGDAGEVLRGWRAYVADAPDEVTSDVLMLTMPPAPSLPEAVHGRRVVVPQAVYAGPPEEGERVLRPLRELGTPLADISSVMPFRFAQAAFDPMYPRGQWRSYWKSAFLTGLPDEAIDVLVAREPDRPGPLTLFHLLHLGGVMGRVDPDQTAFAQRSAPFLFSVDGTWADPADDEGAITHVRSVLDDLRGFTVDGAAYLEMLGAVDDSDQLIQATHGDNLRRLATVKATYDPDNIFRLNRNIAPEAPAPSPA